MTAPARSVPMPVAASPAADPSADALRSPERRRPYRGPLVIGVAYVTAWVVGLSVWPTNLSIASPAGVVLAAYRAQGRAAFLQYLLVEGLAGLLLGALALALARRAHRSKGDPVARAARPAVAAVAAGLAAAAVSVTQWGLGVLLVHTASTGRAGRAHALFEAVNRLDGAKMLLLAVAGAGVVVTHRRTSPVWFLALVAAGAGTLVLSGACCLLLLASGGWTVYLSGPLLLAGVLGLGWQASRPSSG